MNKPSRKPDDGQPKTLDAAKTRIAELEAKLAGKQRIPSTVEPTSNVTSLKKPSNRPNAAPVNAFKETMAAALPSSLQSLEAISNALKAESNPGARLTYLNKAVASYREVSGQRASVNKPNYVARRHVWNRRKHTRCSARGSCAMPTNSRPRIWPKQT